MTEVTFHPPSNFLLEGITQDIEPADGDELIAGTGVDDVLAILASSRDSSFECLVAVINGVPVAVYGVAILDDHGTYGCPWAVFTKTMRKYPKELMKASRGILGRWKKLFPFLENYVDVRNTRAIRWLERLGFEMKEKTVMPTGALFQRFEVRNV